ncbi:MAG: hypothetical protein Q9227_002708 [Pyrenula ochraceoflavens]
MIFEDKFLQNGEQGGKDAAHQLDAAIRGHIMGAFPHIKGAKIMTRVYANVKGLAEACFRSGITDNPAVVQEFVRGFNESKALFDFIDVGVGKDRADGKITELFKHHLDDCHCHQIFLGGSHDNGYARILEESLSREDHQEKVTLLEGVPFERELKELTRYFQRAKFPTVFRENKINVNHQTWAPVVRPYKPTSPDIPPPPGLFATRSASSLDPGSPKPTYSSITAKAPTTVRASISASATSPAPNPTAPVFTPSVNPIKRNRQGQRIDDYDKTIPAHEINKIKEKKLCNVHYLLGECYRDLCSHDHSYTPSERDRKVLAHVARMTPCHSRTACDNPKCIYGHRCTQNDPKKDGCYYGETCHFWGWGHMIDEEVVKTTKV